MENLTPFESPKEGRKYQVFIRDENEWIDIPKSQYDNEHPDNRRIVPVPEEGKSKN